MRDTKQLLPVIPLLLEWATQESGLISDRGRSLSEYEVQIAKRVGVKNTDLVRVLQVTDFLFPEDRLLGGAVKAMGLIGNGVIGITLGYGILIREGHYSERLLAHECRHIHQFEQAGSLDSFLMEYVRGVTEYGYRESPFEIDARSFE